MLGHGRIRALPLLTLLAIGLVAASGCSSGGASNNYAKLTIPTAAPTTTPPTTPSGVSDSPQAVQAFFSSLDSNLQWQGGPPLTGADSGSVYDGLVVELTGSPVDDVTVDGEAGPPQITSFLVSTAQQFAGGQCASWVSTQMATVNSSNGPPYPLSPALDSLPWIVNQSCESISLTFTADPGGDLSLELSWVNSSQ